MNYFSWTLVEINILSGDSVKINNFTENLLKMNNFMEFSKTENIILDVFVFQMAINLTKTNLKLKNF